MSQPTATLGRRFRRSLLRIGVLLLIAYAALSGCVMLFEDNFIYFPTKFPDGLWTLASSTAPGSPAIEDCWITTSDGVKIHGWYCTPSQRALAQAAQAQPPDNAAGDERMVVLWFHGNAGNLSHRYDSVVRLTETPVDVLIIDYRGYGRSEGEPGEAGIYRDAHAAWQYLTEQRGVPARRIVLFGKSLGAVPAIELATQVEPAGVIIESAFTSVPDMAAATMPFLPRFAIRTQMNSLQRIPNVKCPKLFTHSPTDEIIPFAQGRRLFDAAGEPKRFYEVQGAGHNDMHEVGGAAYWNAIRQFIAECAANHTP